ncbi:MAG: metallophosphoesterase [Roseibacillus sp.]
MNPNSLSRRTVLKQTFGFSAAILAGKAPLLAAPTSLTSGASHFTMIGDWGKPGDMKRQKEVATGMTNYLSSRKIKPDAMFLMGDNFYGKMNGGVKCTRFKTQFSAVYPPKVFPGKCYAILGNHEYDDQPKQVKIEAQIGYSKHKPNTRWSMPNKWYRLDLGPKEKPLMTVLCLDSNFSNRRDQLTPEERKEQLAWLKTELSKPRKAPWLVVNGHHPLHSCGHYGDFPEQIAEWDELFRKHKVHFYFCGHEHDLQHLEFEDHPTSFVISGGGGAPIRMPDEEPERGPFVEGVLGFTHLEVTPEKFVVRHVDRESQILHAFQKSPDGTSEVLKGQCSPQTERGT